MKALVFSIHGFDKPYLDQAAHQKHKLIYTQESLDESTVHLAEGCDAVILFPSDDGSANVLEKLSAFGVKYISLRSTGYDHIHIATARSLGIKVANVPSYSPHSIAEHTAALLLSVVRKIVTAQSLISRNDFRLDSLVGFDLHGKTIGIVGTGTIGSVFATIMHGFGCTILGYDIAINTTLTQQINIQYTTFEKLCSNSDIISVHCPLNETTRYLFNRDVFLLMKRGVVFLNTARGGIVNTADLLDAMDDGIIAGAGLDVYENEKPLYFKDHRSTGITDALFERLRSHPNVVLTGHQAFLTKEALSTIAKTTIQHLTEWELYGRTSHELC